MNNNTLYNNSVSDYLSYVQSLGRYFVTLEELKNITGRSEKALFQSIFRLKRNKILAQVRQGFYVIVPPQYSRHGMIPASFFIDGLMMHLKRNYYVGLLSAAVLHGAGQQQIMVFHVLISKPSLREINKKELKMKFFTKLNWPKNHVIVIKTETGFMKVSSPELTAFDLVYFYRYLGGLGRVVPVIEELSENFKMSSLLGVSKSFSYPVIQRMGFIFDEIGKKKYGDCLYKSLKREKMKKVVLSDVHEKRTGNFNDKWKVVVNTDKDWI